MKKIFLFPILISILLISCKSLTAITQEPEVTFDSARITSINFNSVDFLFRYNVNNPNNAAINLERFKYDLIIEGNRFFSGVSPGPLSIARRSISSVDIPVTIYYKELFNIFTNIYRQDTANYTLATEFTIRVPIPFFNPTISLEHSGTFPVLKMPDVALRDVRATGINMLRGTATVEFAVDIINRNTFAINPDSFNFDLSVNRSHLLSSVLRDIDALAPNRSTVVRIPVEISVARVGAELFNYIAGGNNLDVSLNGNMAVRTAFPGLGSANIPFSIERNAPVSR
ncbi:MAG: LEA type 2 family protein [Spirochaetes bacterium]|nr:LEA type 2 family protein [Spirochaetota bacterium]